MLLLSFLCKKWTTNKTLYVTTLIEYRCNLVVTCRNTGTTVIKKIYCILLLLSVIIRVKATTGINN